jgi:hypothetical protein
MDIAFGVCHYGGKNQSFVLSRKMKTKSGKRQAQCSIRYQNLLCELWPVPQKDGKDIFHIAKSSLSFSMMHRTSCDQCDGFHSSKYQYRYLLMSFCH